MSDTQRKILAVVLCVLVLTGCHDHASKKRPGVVFNGVMQMNRIAGATIEAYRVVSGVVEETPFATTTTAANGTFRVTVRGFTDKTTVLFRATGGTFVDEATGATVTLGTTLETFIPEVQDGDVSSVAITPLSNAAARAIRELADGDITAELITDTNTRIGKILGTSGDVITTLPADLASLNTFGQKQVDYALALAALSQMAMDLDLDPNDFTDLVAEDLADGLPDGLNGDVEVFENQRTLTELLAEKTQAAAVTYSTTLSEDAATAIEGFIGADTGSPSSTLTYPVGGETGGGLVTITWTTADTKVGTVRIEVSSNSGASYDSLITDAARDNGSYAWDASSLPSGSHYRVRITPTDSVGTMGEASSSSADFSLDNAPPLVTLLRPTTSRLLSGMTTILWRTDDDRLGTVSIALSHDGGETYPTTIDAAATDTGRYRWDTSSVADGSACRLRIVASNALGIASAAAISDVDFAIDNTAPVTTLTAPTGGQSLRGTTTITWDTEDDNRGTVAIQLSTDGGETFGTTIVESTEDDGSYSWNTASIADTSSLRIRVRATDAAGNSGNTSSSASSISTDNTLPTITLTSNTGGNLVKGTTNITWNANDAHSGTVEVAYSSNGGTSYTVLTSSATFAGPYAWNTTAVTDGGSYRVRVIATDTFGNLSSASASTSNLTIDNTVPVLEISSPDGGEALGDTVDIEWETTDTNPGTVTIELSSDGGDTYDVVLAEDGEDTGSWSWDTTDYDDDTTYRVRITPTDGAGNVGAAVQSAANFEIANNTALFSLYDSLDLSQEANTAIGTGDFDDDGDIDVVLGGTTGCSFYLNDGSGTFTPAASSLDDVGDVEHISVADVNDDTLPDLVLSIDDDVSYLCVNAGDLDFSQEDMGFPVNSHDTCFGDVDNDDDLDLALCNDAGGCVVFLNDGSGTFLDVGEAPGGNDIFRSVVLADLDGDTFLDLVMGAHAWENTQVWLNDQTGHFEDTAQRLRGGSIGALAAGDIDDDGALDLIMGDSVTIYGIEIWINDGEGEFTGRGIQQQDETTTFLFVLMADFNNDELVDAIYGGYSENTGRALQLLPNDFEEQGGSVGILAWDTASTFDNPSQVKAGAYADFDDDGDLDLVVADSSDSALEVWRNSTLR